MDARYRIAKILICALLPLCVAPVLKAQSLMDGQMEVRNLAVSRQEDKLFVSLDLDVSALKVGTNREVVFAPTLSKGEHLIELPAVMVAGRNRYYHHLRNKSAVSLDRLYRSGEQDVIEYRLVVPYEKWMTKAALNVSNTTNGCCGTPILNDVALLENVLPEKDAMAFFPEYVYIRPKAEQKINQIEGSAYIDFPVNRTELYPEYRRNPQELKKILATIDAVREDADTRILGISIKGYASPEGSYTNNVRLAKGRTATLKEYVRGQYHFPDSLFTTSYEPEDWEGLRRFVEGSGLTYRDEILRLIDSDMEPDAKDRKIKVTYRNDYAYLLREVYPGLRHSDYMVRYEVRAYTDPEEIKRLLRTQPQKLSLQEMYLVAQDMEPGSEEYNETFEIAVRMFPGDATANLNAANTAMRLGNLPLAEKYLEKAGDTSEAVYARGIHAALSGNYGAAETLLKEADRKGQEKAKEMLKRLEEVRKSLE